MTAAKDRETNSPKVQLNITKELIAEAVKGDSSHCMVAEAVKEAVPGASHVSVDIQSIRFSDAKKGVRYIYLTPRKAQMAILEFDKGKQPKPFRTTIQGAQVTEQDRKRRQRAHLVKQTANGP